MTKVEFVVNESAAKEHYLVVSDLHLCDIENHADGWKSYKASRYVFDSDFAAVLDSFSRRAQIQDRMVLVLNGDIFDFDLVLGVPDDPAWPVSRRERLRGLRANAEKSAWKLERMIADHPEFIGALVSFLVKGHEIVYVIGNHDREFHFTKVKQTFLNALSSAADIGGVSFAEEQVCFEPWFYHVPGKIYVEHGQQYDYYTSYSHVLSPVVHEKAGERLVLPMGNLANRCLLSQMGYFNPHASDYILNIFHYVWHWLKYYAFTTRLMIYHYVVGSLLVIGHLISTKRLISMDPPDCEQELEQVAIRNQLPLETVRALGDLGKRPITHRFYRMVREFWVDRMILAGIMTGGTISLALVSIPLWIKLMVPLSSFPLLYLIYEWFAHDESVFSVEKEVRIHARKIARLLDVKIITFGHTHKPELLPLGRGVAWVNTGTWAPVMARKGQGGLVPGLRNYLIAEFSEDSAKFALESDLPISQE